MDPVTVTALLHTGWLRRPVSHFISSNAQSVSLLCITRPGVYMLASEWTATKCFSIALQSVYRFRYPPTTMGSRDVHGHKSSCITRLKKYPCTGELRTQKLKSHLVRIPSLTVLPLKPGVGQHVAIHATLTAISSLLIFTLPAHSPAFFPKSLPIFPVLAVTNTWFRFRPTE